MAAARLWIAANPRIASGSMEARRYAEAGMNTRRMRRDEPVAELRQGCDIAATGAESRVVSVVA
jgi:hypothetical protein